MPGSSCSHEAPAPMSLVRSIRRPFGTALRFLRSPEERQDLWWELRRRRSGEPDLPGPRIERVLVVCFGNICRSPFAERLLARECAGLMVRSAGFEAGEGAPAQPEAIRVAAEFGIDLSDHAARRLLREDVEWADLILGMTGRHHAMLRARWPDRADRLRLLGDYLPQAPYALEDPWGCPPDVFRAVYRRIERAAAGLAERIAERDVAAG